MKIFTTLLLFLLPVSAGAQSMQFLEATSGGNCNSCFWVAAEGGIEKDTPLKLEKFLEEIGHKPNQSLRITLNSTGGDLLAGLELGRVIRKNGLKISISKTTPMIVDGKKTPYNDKESGICYSACAYAFLGGVQRSIGKNDKYGLHQFYMKEALSTPLKEKYNSVDLSANQVITGLIAAYISEMGVDAALIKLASNISPWQDIYILSAKEISQYKIDNSKPTTSDWQLKTVNSGLVAFVKQQQEQAEEGVKTLSIYCSSPNKDMYLSMSATYKANNIEQYYSGDISLSLNKSLEFEIRDSGNSNNSFTSLLIIKKVIKENNEYLITLGVMISLKQLRQILKMDYLDTYANFGQRYFFVGHGNFPIKKGKKEIIAALNNCI